MQKTKLLQSFFLNIYALVRIRVLSMTSNSIITNRELYFLEQYSALRTEFANHYQWPIPHSGVDVDDYDSHTESTYIIAHLKNNVLAGVRFTKIPSVKDSLSLSMWQNAVDTLAIEDIELKCKQILQGKNVELWDVTRLMTYNGLKSERTKKERMLARCGVLKVLIEGYHVAGGQNHSWIFTVDSRMMKFLKKQDFPVHVLASGKISSVDTDVNYLCIIEPGIAMAAMKENMTVFHQVVLSVYAKRGRAI